MVKAEINPIQSAIEEAALHEPAFVQKVPALRPAWRIVRPFFQASAGFLQDDGLMMAGHLAFVSMLAFFPFLIFLVALAGFLGRTDAGAELVAVLLYIMPPAVSDVVGPPVNAVIENPRGDLLTFGIVATIWTAGSGIEALRRVLNRALSVREYRPIWRTRAKSMSFVVMFAGIIVIGLTLLIVGPVAYGYVSDFLNLPESWADAFAGVRFGATPFSFLLVVVILYQFLPAQRLKLRHTVPGAVLVIVLWISAAIGFSRYLAVMGSYDVTYGSLGGMIITMIFFYIVGAIFIWGAEFNAALAHIYEARQAEKNRNISENT